MPVRLDQNQKKILRAANWERLKPFRYVAAAFLLFVAVALALNLPDPDASNLTETEIADINGQETYEGALPSSLSAFSSVEELYAAAELVIECKVVKTSGNVEDLDRAFLLVETVLKGEAGGTLTVREDACDVPLMKQNQHLILFLVPCDPEESLDDYRLVGGYQGKFIEREGRYFQQATADVKLSAEVYSPLTKGEFFALLGYVEG